MWGVVAAALVVTGLATHVGATFNPANYAGTWSGTWKNNTFHVSGPISATLEAAPDGSPLSATYTISNLFNCGPTTATRVLTKGTDFTDAGLNFAATNSAFGTATISSVSKPKVEKISGSGTPTCRVDIASYSLRAKLKSSLLKGKMTIVFSAGSPRRAKAIFKATKQ